MQTPWPNCSSSFSVRLPTYNYVCSVLSLHTAAAEMNKDIDSKGMRIYGLLTDLMQFKFYSYHPPTNQFYVDEIIVVDLRRISSSSGMITGKVPFLFLIIFES